MKRIGAVALGDVAARATHIEVACTRCDRKGRYLLTRLVRDLGPDFAMTDLARQLTICTRRQAAAAHERCDVFFPNLVRAMESGEPARVSRNETDNFDDDD